MDAYQRKLWWTQIHNIKLKEQEQIEIKHMSNWILDDLVYNKSWFCYVLFRFSQTAVKTFNPYKSHVSRPSQQGSNTGILSARSLLTSLKWFLRHNRLQSRHSLQAGSQKKNRRGVGKAITTSKSSLFTETTEGEIKGDPCLSGLWPLPVRGWEWGSA